MKRSAIILLLFLAVPALLTSCLFDEEDLFDQSASERIEAAKQEAKTILESAENGSEGVALFTASETGQYDIILMDVQMPVMDGYEATRAIRASVHPDANSIPILAMTANAFDEDRRNALECGMNGFLSKPIVIADLVQEMRKVL